MNRDQWRTEALCHGAIWYEMPPFHRASFRQHPVLTAEDTPHTSLSKSLHSNPFFKQRKGTRSDEQPTNATLQQQGTRTCSVAAFTERLDTDALRKNRRANDDLPQEKLPAMTTSETTQWPHRSMNFWSWQPRARQKLLLATCSTQDEHVPRHVFPWFHLCTRALVFLCACGSMCLCIERWRAEVHRSEAFVVVHTAPETDDNARVSIN